jgi:glycosyltransferase involved in cell wall biosynthesis/2-polyprenyl-3-methyl-5-hydroxy-6-metoxy-1,4-benzoquinol methylase
MDLILVGHGYRPVPPEAADSPSIVIDALAHALSARGIRVTVVCGASPSAARRYEVIELPGPALIGRRSAKFAELSFAADARRVVASIAADLVQYHAPTPAALASKRYGTRILLEWSAPMSSSGRVPTMGRLSAASALTEAIACRRADTVIVKTAFSAAYARRVYHVPPSRLAVIPNGVDVDRFTPSPSEPSTPTILNVARIARYKDQSTLVRALNHPALRDRDVRLVLAGPADDPAYAERLVRLARGEGVEGRIEVLGPVEVAHLPDLYRSATVVACPSLAEGAVPLALLEAMSCGRPIIASAIEQHLEVGPHAGVTFVPPGDPEAAARALAEMLDSTTERARAGRAARRRVEEGFSWTAVAERFERLYLRLLESPQVARRRAGHRPTRPPNPLVANSGRPGEPSVPVSPPTESGRHDDNRLGGAVELYDSWDDSAHGAHETVLRAIGSATTVLDVGCATGNLALRVMARGGAVVGVEPSQAAAEIARSRGIEVIIGRFDRSTLDALGGRQFGTIVFADSLEHMADPLEALVLARELLEADGGVVISIPNVVVWHARALVAFGRFEYRPSGIFDRTHLRFFTLTTARHLVEVAGYRVERVNSTRMTIQLGPGWLRNLFNRAYGRLTRYAPSLFSEQFVFVAHPTGEAAIGGSWP